MLKKGYAVNGVARTKHYEGVTAPCDAGGEGRSCVQVSNSGGACELLIRHPSSCRVSRSLACAVCLTARSQNVRGVCACVVVRVLAGRKELGRALELKVWPEPIARATPNHTQRRKA